jgi:hypothetical protein
MYMICEKSVVYYTKKFENYTKWIFNHNLKLLSFYKHNIELTKYLHTFKNSYIFKNDKQKSMSCIGTIIKIFYKICKIFHEKIHLYEKKLFLDKKTCHYEKLHPPNHTTL